MVIWVCSDCMFSREYAEIPENVDCEPWREIPKADIAKGIDCGIPNHWEEDSDDHSENCERQDFSWSRCDGCGSALGGTRHAYTLWEDERQ